MKIFVDTADLQEIEESLKRGFVRGITTNPSLIAKQEGGDFEGHVKKIVTLINRYEPKTDLSVEVFSRDPEEILKQAVTFNHAFSCANLSIKIQVGWEELEAIHRLRELGFRVNCTCCMTVTQALMAAAAGARYVSLFVGRIRDGGSQSIFAEQRQALDERDALSREDHNPFTVIQATHKLLERDYPETEIIAGSMRSVTDVKNSALAGAHIVTVPPKFFPDMISHFKTDEVVAQFFADFKAWVK